MEQILQVTGALLVLAGFGLAQFGVLEQRSLSLSIAKPDRLGYPRRAGGIDLAVGFSVTRGCLGARITLVAGLAALLG
jgi:hypothetical protein